MKNLPSPEIWFITGSQHLYGEETLKQVAAHSRKIVDELTDSKKMALPLIFKSLVTTPQEILRACQEASGDPNCGGVILWMHTFSPSKMWIGGLSALTKPFLHLHTQFNRDLPPSIMDFTDPKWRRRIGWSPTHGEWQLSVTAIRLVHGEAAARPYGANFCSRTLHLGSASSLPNAPVTLFGRSPDLKTG